MSNTGTIRVALKIDDKGVVRGFQDISKESENAGRAGKKAFLDMDKGASSFEKSAAGAGKTVAKLTAGLAALAGAASTVIALAGAMEEYQQAVAKAGVSTGTTADEAERLGDISLNVWASGVGDSIEQVSNAVVTASKKMKGAGDDALAFASTAALSIERVWGDESKQVITTAATLVDQFGISFEQAFDFVVSGYQRGLNSSEDFLDSISEYSVQFANAGADAGQFFSVLKTGLQGGVLGTDKAADMFKEFSVRIVDGSKTTRDALGLLGIDADRFTGKIADGSITVADAFDTITARIAGVDDVLVQSQAGVGLLGTQFEDMGNRAALAVNTAAVSLDDMKGAVQGLEDQYGTLGQEVTQTARILTGIAITAWEDYTRAAAQELDGLNKEILEHKRTIAVSLSYLGDTVVIMSRTFELAGKTISVMLLGIEREGWKLSNALVNGPIAALQLIIDMYNKIPMLPDISLPQGLLNYGAGINESLDLANKAVAAGLEDIRELLTRPLPGNAIRESLNESEEAAGKTGEALRKVGERGLETIENLGNAQSDATDEHIALLESFTEAHKKATLTRWEYALQKLDEDYDKYDKVVKDKLALEEWFSAKLSDIVDDRNEAVAKSLENYFAEIDAAEEELIKEMDRLQEKQVRDQKRAHEEMVRANERFLERIHGATSDVFYDLFTNGPESAFKNMLNRMTDYLSRTLSDWAAQAILEPIIVPVMGGIFGSGGGGSVSLSGGSGGMGINLPMPSWDMLSNGWDSITSGSFFSNMPSMSDFGTALKWGPEGLAYAQDIAPAGVIKASNIISSVSAGAFTAFAGVILSKILDKFSTHGAPDPFLGIQTPGLSTPGMFPGTMLSQEFPIQAFVGDVGNQQSEIDNAVIAYFDAVFGELDKYTNQSISTIISNLPPNMRHFVALEDFGGDIQGAMQSVSDTVFGEMFGVLLLDMFPTEGEVTTQVKRLMDRLPRYGSGRDLYDAGVDTFDADSGAPRTGWLDVYEMFDVQISALAQGPFNQGFFESLIPEGGDNVWDGFLRFASVVDKSDDFMADFTNRIQNLGEGVLEAFENIELVIGIMDQVTAALDAVGKASSTSQLDQVRDSWDAVITTLEEANATTAQVAEAEAARNQVLGAQLSGLTASSLEGVLMGQGSVDDIIEKSFKSHLAGDLAENLYETYIAPINEGLAAAFGEDGDFQAAADYLESIDLSPLKSQIDGFDSLFGSGGTDAIGDVMDKVQASLDGIATPTTVKQLEQVRDHFSDLKSELEEIGNTTVELTELEKARNQAVGASVSGLTADSLQGVLTGEADLLGTIKDTFLSQALGRVSTDLYDQYLAPINEGIGKAFGDDSDFQGVIDYLQTVDFTDLEKEIQAVQDAVNVVSAKDEDPADPYEYYNTAKSKLVASYKAEIEKLEGDQAALEKTLADAKAAYIDALNAEISAKQDEISVQQDAIDAAQDLADAWLDLADSLAAAKMDILMDGAMFESDRADLAESRYKAALQGAWAGDMDAAKELPTLAKAYMDTFKGTTTTKSEYDSMVAALAIEMGTAQGVAESQANAQLDLVDQGQDQIDILEGQIDALQAQKDAVEGVSTTILGVAAAEKAWTDAQTALTNSTITTSIGDLQVKLDNLTIPYANIPKSVPDAETDFKDAGTAIFNPGNWGISIAEAIAAIEQDPINVGKLIQQTPGVEVADIAAWYNSHKGTSWTPNQLKKYLGFSGGGTISGPESGYHLPPDTEFHGVEHIVQGSEMTAVKELLQEIRGLMITAIKTGGDTGDLVDSIVSILKGVVYGKLVMNAKDKSAEDAA